MLFVTLEDSNLKCNNLPLINYIISATEKSCKMALKLYQKWFKKTGVFVKNIIHYFVHFGPYDLVQILSACI